MRADPRFDEAKGIPISEVASRLDLKGLKPAGRERVGPCPACGGSDRFSISPDRNVFNCRNCGGGDGIRLVELALGLGFKDALKHLVGEAPASIDPEEKERRRKQREKQERDRENRAAIERKKAIKLAVDIWRSGEPAEGSLVRAYLERRGITRALLPDLPTVIRFHPSLRYMAKADREWQVIHEGPAMLGAVSGPDGRVIGVHRTWIDPEHPSGKAQITGLDGKPAVAKKMLGSKKGGSIRLVAPRDQLPVLVMAEGIETTFSAVVARPISGAAYWCGVDLGNMSGSRLVVTNPDTNKRSSRFSELPDLNDREAFIPPPWLKRLVYVQDGDSSARETRAKLLAGLARARHAIPGLRTQIVHAGDGVDLNDVLRSDAND